MKHYLIIALSLFFSFQLVAQEPKRVFVYLKDKAHTPYSLEEPEEFLSPQSLARREKQGIELKESDLPVDPNYVQQIRDVGVEVIYTSKWLNAALIEYPRDSSFYLDSVLQLPFVKGPELLTLMEPAQSVDLPREQPRNNLSAYHEERLPKSAFRVEEDHFYGASQRQIEMLGAQYMHEAGFMGQGITIAVMDGGFHNVHKHQAFKHLYAEGRLLGTYDFYKKDSGVYTNATHGAKVLSCLAAYQPQALIGTAPKAQYYLFRTEVVATENPQECAYWVIAAEKADSLGVDVISTSLGYSTFDDTSMNYSYEDLDGDKSFMTRAADLAASKGILVVNSAGNEGNNNKWGGYITIPSDGDSVLTVGAVKSNGSLASFSSTGPTPDGRIKPDLCAMGHMAAVVNTFTDTNYSFSNGTSFSCPIMAGFAASFWAQFPELTNMELIEILRQSASKAENPDSQMGFGIPNYQIAVQLAQAKAADSVFSPYQIIPNPVEDEALVLKIPPEQEGKRATIQVFSADGKNIHSYETELRSALVKLHLRGKKLQPGMYIVRIEVDGQSQATRFIKQ